MDATVKATRDMLVIRLANGAAVSSVEGLYETYQHGGKLIYRGRNLRRALTEAVEAEPVPMGKYTHRDSDGMLWRWEGGRPIAQIADDVMLRVLGGPD